MMHDAHRRDKLVELAQEREPLRQLMQKVDKKSDAKYKLYT